MSRLLHIECPPWAPCRGCEFCRYIHHHGRKPHPPIKPNRRRAHRRRG